MTDIFSFDLQRDRLYEQVADRILELISSASLRRRISFTRQLSVLFSHKTSSNHSISPPTGSLTRTHDGIRLSGPSFRIPTITTAPAISNTASPAHHQRRRVRRNLLSVNSSVPHSGHVSSPSSPTFAPRMSYQHFGHRSRPRGLSHQSAQMPNPTLTTPAAARMYVNTVIHEDVAGAIFLPFNSRRAQNPRRHPPIPDTDLRRARHKPAAGSITISA